MADHPDFDPQIERVWRSYLTTGTVPKDSDHHWFESPHIIRPLMRRLATDPRCRICYYPFEGIGGKIVHTLLGVERSRLNPQICNTCQRFAEKYRGGTEIEASFLFADVRGSTSIAERMNAYEFGQLINRFYQAATRALFNHNGMVEKLIGDEVTGFFVPAFAGEKHARVAVEAGKEILKVTGNEGNGEPWIPVGVGVHIGEAYIGSVGTEEGGVDIAVLGDTVNTAARLTSLAKAGEMIISEAARAAAGLEKTGMESRCLDLKGREEPVDAWVIQVS